MEESGDAVIGVVDRSRLSGALTAIHRGGHGHNARVLDGARGDIVGQLRRAGVSTDFNVDPRAKDVVLVLLHAPGRTRKVAELLHRAGANAVHVVNRADTADPQPDDAGVFAYSRGKKSVADGLSSD